MTGVGIWRKPGSQQKARQEPTKRPCPLQLFFLHLKTTPFNRKASEPLSKFSKRGLAIAGLVAGIIARLEEHELGRDPTGPVPAGDTGTRPAMRAKTAAAIFKEASVARALQAAAEARAL